MPSADSTDNPITVGQAIASFASTPVETLLRRWNWKTAALSACVRGSIFFLANLGAGFSAAIDAMLLESAFYAVVAGFQGAIIQTFRRVEPAWAATATVMALPAINHTLEFALHSLGGTKKIAAGIAASITLSILSAMFNLFAMRRGALIVGAGRQSLASDLRRLPGIIFEFFTVIPRLLWRMWQGNEGKGIKAVDQK